MIIQAIGTLGFPIVCCGALFWMIVDNNKRYSDEREKMTTAINNNTEALTKLLERMGDGEGNSN